MRRLPEDDYTHEPEPVFNYNESRYDRWVRVREAALSSDYDTEMYPLTNRITVATDDHTYGVDGDVWSNIPLRNQGEGMLRRITEGMTRWRYGDLEGAGLSEYLDQIVDGTPVGTGAGI